LIAIYTDGSSRGNPGPGGYGIVLKYKDHRKELSEGFKLTTNNRMELLAVIVGLEALKSKKQAVTIYSDSKYVIEAVQKGWLISWLKKDFKGKKNADLWKRFWRVYQQHDVSLCWLKGHAGDVENERCDQLAVQSAQQKMLSVDQGYLNSVTQHITHTWMGF
jgi:ribonuclease HI